MDLTNSNFGVGDKKMKAKMESKRDSFATIDHVKKSGVTSVSYRSELGSPDLV